VKSDLNFIKHECILKLMRRGISKFLTLLSVISGVTLIVLINTTSPTEVGLMGVFFLFVLLYFSCLGLIYLILSCFRKIRWYLSGRNTDNKKSLWPYAVSGSFLPLILLSLRSFGSLNFFSAVACISVLAITWFLLSKQ